MSAYDVAALLKAGRWRYKALTGKAEDAFAVYLGIKSHRMLDSAEWFIYSKPDQHEWHLSRMRAAGLSVDEGKPRLPEGPKPWEI